MESATLLTEPALLPSNNHLRALRMDLANPMLAVVILRRGKINSTALDLAKNSLITRLRRLRLLNRRFRRSARKVFDESPLPEIQTDLLRILLHGRNQREGIHRRRDRALGGD